MRAKFIEIIRKIVEAGFVVYIFKEEILIFITFLLRVEIGNLLELIILYIYAICRNIYQAFLDLYVFLQRHKLILFLSLYQLLQCQYVKNI